MRTGEREPATLGGGGTGHAAAAPGPTVLADAARPAASGPAQGGIRAVEATQAARDVTAVVTAATTAAVGMAAVPASAVARPHRARADRHPERGTRTEPVQRFVTVHGYRRAYLRAGRGSPILFIHGIGDSSVTWAPVLSDLARHHTVIAPDLLGHGLSDKPRADYSVGGFANGMRDLLAVLGISRATVIGHSLGGGVAMQFAYQFPEHCERLVLVATGGVGVDLHPTLRLAASPGGGEALLSLLRLPAARLVGQSVISMLGLLGTDLGRDAADLGRVFDTLGAPAARAAFLRTLRAAVDARGQAITMLDRCYLARGMPTLIVWGGHDAVIPVAHAAVAHEAMPGSRLEIFADAGHFPHHTHPARFAALIEEFLAQTRPASHSPREWRALLREHTLPAVPESDRETGPGGGAPPPAHARRPPPGSAGATVEDTAGGLTRPW